MPVNHAINELNTDIYSVLDKVIEHFKTHGTDIEVEAVIDEDNENYLLYWDNHSIEQLNTQYIELSAIFNNDIDIQCILSYMYLLLWQQYFSNWYTNLLYQSDDNVAYYQQHMRHWLNTYDEMLKPLEKRRLINSKAISLRLPSTIDWQKVNQAFRKETGVRNYKGFRTHHHLSNVQANDIYDTYLHTHASKLRNQIRDLIDDQLDELTDSLQNQWWFNQYDDIFEKLNDHNYQYYDNGNSKMYLITQ